MFKFFKNNRNKEISTKEDYDIYLKKLLNKIYHMVLIITMLIKKTNYIKYLEIVVTLIAP